jgi:ATP-dependent exoDNAse (exonuclease V) beta subunit
MSRLPDHEQRRQAVLTEGHAFVWASAGTGKTHTLTLRALFLLLTAPFQGRAKGTECVDLYASSERVNRMRAARGVIRRFVLTTFTRKAAAEMQARLFAYFDLIASAEDLESLKAVVSELNQGHGDDQLIEVAELVLEKLGGRYDLLRRGAEALAELAAELQVCTLHSMAVAMLRRHPIAAGIPPAARFAEEDEAVLPDVPEMVVSRWWEYVAADTRLSREFEQLSETVTFDQMTAWLLAVFEERWLVESLDLGKGDDKRVDRFLEAMNKLSDHPKAGKQKNVQEVCEAIRPSKRSWDRVCQVVYEGKGKLFLDGDPTEGVKAGIATLPPDEREVLESFSRLYPSLVHRYLREEKSEAWELWRVFVKAFAAWSETAVTLELGVVTFDDMIRLTAELLRKNSAIRREERERLWGILVDEFQDTDPLQLEVLEHLVRRERKNDHEVTGFFVGDEKQSIYRFRDADLPAILRFHKRYREMVQSEKVGEFRLSASFRSLPPILAFVNDFFERAVPLQNYANEKLEPVRPDGGVLPQWRMLDREATRGETAEARTWLARETARLISEHHGQGGLGDGAYKDVVVLVRTYKELEALLPVLEEAGIPVVSSGARTFYHQPEVLDVLNLLIAAYHPRDTLAVGALLRSPVIGLADDAIARLLAAVPAGDLFHGTRALPADVDAAVLDRIQRMRALVQSRQRSPVTIWLREAKAFVPMNLYAARDAEGRALVRIENVLAAFRDAVETGRVTPLEWLLAQRARAQETFDSDQGEDVSVTDESMAAVRVMTIHKAKGLQGKFVIVYGWQSALDVIEKPSRDKGKAINLTGPDGVAVRGFSMDWGAVRVVSAGYFPAVALDDEYASAEGRRLAYVAATRARDRLVMLSPVIENTCSAKVSDGLLDIVRVAPDLGEEAGNGGVPRVAHVKPRGYDKLWLDRDAAMRAGLGEALLHRPSKPEHDGERDAVEETDFAREKREVAMAAGTLVHLYLEHHATDVTFEEAKIEVIRRELKTEIKAVDRARESLVAFYGGAYRRRFDGATILGRELPVYLSHEGNAWSGVIDLVLEEGGVVRGIDYKLMMKPKALPDHYRRQQTLYTEALQRVFPGREVAFEFWWLG